VTGVQSMGVLAVVKHFAFNNQETNRNTEVSFVDEKTKWELYYPPFQAAVDAGVSAFMCAYNKHTDAPHEGAFACSNAHLLRDDLKGKMGFRGFVQSDWGATHSTTIADGLDQEMPMVADHPDASVPYWFSRGALLNSSNASTVATAATRVVAATLRLNLSSECTPPYCEEMLSRNATTAAHITLAEEAATAAVVLLQNHDALLPLRSGVTRSVAIIGEAAAGRIFDINGENQGEGEWNTGDYYSGGGSGHVVSPNGSQGYTVTAYDGIARRAQLAGLRVIASLSNDVADGLAAARRADVAIVVGGATSGEDVDRANLNLDNGADELIEAVASAAPTVVLAHVCGAVLTPWRHKVGAILALFLGGQRTGAAWAKVLFGDHSPTGKLPISLPDAESDTILPSSDHVISYQEGMATGYRNTAVVPAFPFGHGLSYTSFDFGSPRVASCGKGTTQRCVDFNVTNTGDTPGATVAQLYIEFPPCAHHPSKLLKGFAKTPVLAPAAQSQVRFRLTQRDRSYYDTARGGWEEVEDGRLKIHVGASSVDIRSTRWLGVERVR